MLHVTFLLQPCHDCKRSKWLFHCPSSAVKVLCKRLQKKKKIQLREILSLLFFPVSSFCILKLTMEFFFGAKFVQCNCTVKITHTNTSDGSFVIVSFLLLSFAVIKKKKLHKFFLNIFFPYRRHKSDTKRSCQEKNVISHTLFFQPLLHLLICSSSLAVQQGALPDFVSTNLKYPYA